MDDFCTYQLKITFVLDLFLITKMKNLNTKYEMNNEKTTEWLYYTVTRLLWRSEAICHCSRFARAKRPILIS